MTVFSAKDVAGALLDDSYTAGEWELEDGTVNVYELLERSGCIDGRDLSMMASRYAEVTIQGFIKKAPGNKLTVDDIGMMVMIALLRGVLAGIRVADNA